MAPYIVIAIVVVLMIIMAFVSAYWHDKAIEERETNKLLRKDLNEMKAKAMKNEE